MKSLNIVQTIAKVLKIICMIAFVFSIVGAAFSLLGALLLIALPNLVDVAEMEEIMQSVVSDVPFSFADLGISMMAAVIIIIGGCVVLGFTYKYFKNELIDGTPFTHRGARELRILGILHMAIPVGTGIIATIVTAFASLSDISSTDTDISLGLALLLLSFVFDYGADVLEQKNAEAQVNGSEFMETIEIARAEQPIKPVETIENVETVEEVSEISQTSETEQL